MIKNQSKTVVKKDVDNTFDLINAFESGSATYKIEDSETFLNGAEAMIRYSDDFLNIRLVSKKEPDNLKGIRHKLRKDLTLKNFDSTFEVKSHSIKKIVLFPRQESFTAELTVNNIANLEFKNDKYRLVCKTQKEPNFAPFFTTHFEINSFIYMRLMNVEIMGHTFDCFSCKKEGKHYLIIDCNTEIALSDFRKATNAFLLVIGLFTGNLYKGENYILSGKNKFVEYSNTEKSVITNIQLVDSIQGGKSHVSFDTFSVMCSRILCDYKMERIIRLILEGNSTDSVLLRSAIYSVGLETLTEIIVDKNEDKVKPISNKNFFKEIRDKLFETLDSFELPTDSSGYKILSKKIMNLNSPTNRDKLEKPFKLYGIKLNEHDKETIEHRNKFLHGTSPIVGFEESEDKRIELLLIAHKMNFLVCSLLLKHLEYSGHVCNYFAKLEEKAKGESSEKFIREI